MSGASQGFFGQAGAYDEGPEFHVRQHAAHIRTGTLVKILAVHGGGVDAAPTVDVQVLVKQSDGVGNTSSHSTVYGIPATRNQGGLNAIINDPVVGDVYHMTASDRDISSVKTNNGAESNPGSYRRHDLADGVLGGAALGKKPTTHINFNGGQIALTTTGNITLTDGNGNVVALKSGGIFVFPGTGKVFLGSQDGTSCFAVQTTNGPSPNVFAKA